MQFTRRGILILATGMGVGYSPWFPGTLGSIWGVLICAIAIQWELSIAVYAISTLLLFLAGVPICSHAARFMNTKDPGAIVWDEIAAMPVVFLPLIGTTEKPIAIPLLVLGFLLFRLFDITKPWPIRSVERLPGGWGIMADDTMAACYAAIALLLANRIW